MNHVKHHVAKVEAEMPKQWDISFHSGEYSHDLTITAHEVKVTAPDTIVADNVTIVIDYCYFEGEPKVCD